MRFSNLMLLATAAVAGCAWGTDVEKGPLPETFTVSQTYAPARGGLSTANTVATNMANAKCAEMGREVYVRETTKIPWPPTVEIVFQCIDTGARS